MSALGIYVLDFCLAFQSFPAPILWCQLLSSTGCIFVEIGSCRYNSQTQDWSGGGLFCPKYKSPKWSREGADSTPTLWPNSSWLAPTPRWLFHRFTFSRLHTTLAFQKLPHIKHAMESSDKEQVKFSSFFCCSQLDWRSTSVGILLSPLSHPRRGTSAG